ncbi:uncharacterized protein SCHCODRAFT_02489717 [Schizophyllum commune H4-8]|nr:uncharacterized protein SCHCODRAFT_02489717 [Schizophyllum commune H4-8]KAI4523000.1 hypothetical protein K525DRAFT_255076 [Schizophyllum commune Loenen D]KAI5897464.1 hypothetical protein SCHCODRAFT_02489717 [Schizophyllum commune H4-8]
MLRCQEDSSIVCLLGNGDALKDVPSAQASSATLFGTYQRRSLHLCDVAPAPMRLCAACPDASLRTLDDVLVAITVLTSRRKQAPKRSPGGASEITQGLT